MSHLFAFLGLGTGALIVIVLVVSLFYGALATAIDAGGFPLVMFAVLVVVCVVLMIRAVVRRGRQP